jgi:hypothetical protein
MADEDVTSSDEPTISYDELEQVDLLQDNLSKVVQENVRSWQHTPDIEQAKRDEENGAITNSIMLLEEQDDLHEYMNEEGLHAEITNEQTTENDAQKRKGIRQIGRLSRTKTKQQIMFEYDHSIKERQKEEVFERTLRREMSKSDLKNEQHNGAKKFKTIEEFLSLPILTGIEEIIAQEAREYGHSRLISSSSPIKRTKLLTMANGGSFRRATFQAAPTISPSKKKLREELRFKKEKLEQRKLLVQEMYDRALERKSRLATIPDNPTYSQGNATLPEISTRLKEPSFFLTETAYIEDERKEMTPDTSYTSYSKSSQSRRKKNRQVVFSDNDIEETATPTPVEENGIAVDNDGNDEKSVKSEGKKSKRKQRRRERTANSENEILARSRSTSPVRVFRGGRGWDGSVHVRTFLSQVNSHVANDSFHELLHKYQKVASSRGEQFTINTKAIANYGQYLKDNRRLKVRSSSIKPFNNYANNQTEIV